MHLVSIVIVTLCLLCQDQLDTITKFFDAQLDVVRNVRSLYEERISLEREYAAKLDALCKKASEKRAKIESSVVVGDNFTKPWDENTLRQSTINSAYDTLIKSISSSAQDRINIADSLTKGIVDALQAVDRSNEHTKKGELLFYQRLLTERDKTYNERAKARVTYDADCEEVDALRQKQNRAQVEKHADKAASQLEQQRSDMLNRKNVYLISTTVANKVKAKFFDEDLPALEDTVQTKFIQRFASILIKGSELELQHLDTLKQRVNTTEAALKAVDPEKDFKLFVEYNVRPFSAPVDWSFEPCATYYDTDEISLEPQPKIFLQNKLSRSRGKLAELEPVILSKERDLEKLQRLVATYEADPSLGSLDEMTEKYFDSKHQLVFSRTSKAMLEAEIGVLSSALGGDFGDQRPHSFKSTSFSIPTHCGYCKSSIWGLSKQGKSCQLCGLSVHSKCELKVPADCLGSKEARRASASVSRSSSVSLHSTSSIRRGQTILSTISPPTQIPTRSSSVREESVEETHPKAHVMFDFTPTSQFELAVSVGMMVRLLEPDDGSGWVKVSDPNGRSGLVPASYVNVSGGNDEDGEPSASVRARKPLGQYSNAASLLNQVLRRTVSL
ncbi:hypothetical protein FISHEDRAFT_49111 [Fistulina hepatica ATCC 64428]|uniref:FCH-domain-containing protein n=1 Tax=Fistulina hepatica ATCC 64428 TaxID=1128425 RepID=A0A0D7A5B5_9AGAR|nr:hypothetical protein FISHEDRAFT_49111 [Fistulina hepatica ATCC 64428]